MSKHTPGPYYRAGLLICANTPKGQAELAIVDTYCEYVSRLTADANANLFCAAPDLLAACKAFLAGKPQCECTDDSGCSLAAARKLAKEAIAKAEGKP